MIIHTNDLVDFYRENKSKINVHIENLNLNLNLNETIWRITAIKAINLCFILNTSEEGTEIYIDETEALAKVLKDSLTLDESLCAESEEGYYYSDNEDEDEDEDEVETKAKADAEILELDNFNRILLNIHD